MPFLNFNIKSPLLTSRIRLGVLCGRYHLDSKRSDSFSSLFAIYASSRQVLISTLCRFLPADFTADNRSFHANSTYAKTPYCYCSAFSSKSQELYLISRPPKIHSPFRYRVFLAESLGRVLSSVPPKNPRTSFSIITSSGKVILTPPQNVKNFNHRTVFNLCLTQSKSTPPNIATNEPPV